MKMHTVACSLWIAFKDIYVNSLVQGIAIYNSNSG